MAVAEGDFTVVEVAVFTAGAEVVSPAGATMAAAQVEVFTVVEGTAVTTAVDRLQAAASAACVEVRSVDVLPQCPANGHGKDARAPAILHRVGIHSLAQPTPDPATSVQCLQDQVPGWVARRLAPCLTVTGTLSALQVQCEHPSRPQRVHSTECH